MVGWPGLRASSTGGKPIGAAELIFKKAFGIDVGPVEPFTWLLEMRDAVFAVEAAGLTWSVSSGRVGIDDKEKLAIGLFKHSDERDPRFITEISTLNLTAPADIEGAKDLDDRRSGVAAHMTEFLAHGKPRIPSAEVAGDLGLEAPKMPLISGSKVRVLDGPPKIRRFGDIRSA